MIKSLQKKIGFLLVFLFAVLLLTVLGIFAWNSYLDNRSALLREFKDQIRQTKWTHFIETEGKACDFDASYCVVAVAEDQSIRLLFQTFTDRSEDELLEFAAFVNKASVQTARFSKYTVISHYMKKYGRVLVIIDARQALADTTPIFITCAAVAVLGLLLFSLGARQLSRLLTRPVEETLAAERKFISDASHELKTPLAVISANAQLLADEGGADNKHLGYIQQETTRMITLVNRMLTLARLDAPQAKPSFSTFSASEALLDLIYPMESIAYEKHLSLSIEVPEHLPQITADQAQFQNLVSILMNNALTYTPENGTITVRASSRNHRLFFSVANTGDAIPEEVRERMFERFYRADNARTDGKHFGLGLSIARSIVSGHGGKISVERDGDKNVFSVVLPLSPHV